METESATFPVPPIYTRSLTLRPPVESDIPFSTAIANDPKNNTYLPHFIKNPPTLESTAKWNKMMVEGQTRPQFQKSNVFLNIVETASGTILGDSGLGSVETDSVKGGRKAEVGVMINWTHCGKGYAVEALYATVNFGFDKVDGEGVDRIVMGTMRTNEPMRGVFEKVFGLEGVLDERGFGMDYCIERAEWEEGGMKHRVAAWLKTKEQKMSIA